MPVSKISGKKSLIKIVKSAGKSKSKKHSVPKKLSGKKSKTAKSKEIESILIKEIEKPPELMNIEIRPVHEPEKNVEVPEDIADLVVSAPAAKTPVQESSVHTAAPEKDDLHELKNQVEALLFACGKYMDEGSISGLCGIDKRKIHRILEGLRDDYDSRNNALALFQEDKSWKINVREKYVSLVRKIVSDTELPRGTMETLAVIAWKTPLYQSEVVRIRGNKCYDHIEELVTQGFITKEKKGRSFVLKTTDKFYNYFDIDRKNMSSVMDAVKLPELEPEQATLISDTIPVEETDKVAAIELRKRVETDEDKLRHHTFLNGMEQKILEVAKKNIDRDAEIPARHSGLPSFEDTLPEITERSEAQDTTEENPHIDAQSDSDNIVLENGSLSEEELVIDTTQKPKKLTKKQLEKKFREDLVRVREKMEKR